jgi:hypothetical protein
MSMSVQLYHSDRFETQADWLAHLRGLDGKPDLGAAGEPRRDRGPDNAWAGGAYENVRRLAEHGWPEGAARMAETSRAAVPFAPPVSRPCLGYDVAGAYPDVPLAVAGDPCSMVTMGEEMIQTRPAVRLYAEMAASSLVNSRQIEHFGAAILSHVDSIEQSGVRCELNLVWTCEGKEEKICQTVIVAKKAEDHLDYERIAFLLMHPGMFRRLIFDLWARDSNYLPIALHRARGRPTRAILEDQDGIVLPSINESSLRCSTLAGAVEVVRSALEEGLTRIGHPMRWEALEGED